MAAGTCGGSDRVFVTGSTYDAKFGTPYGTSYDYRTIGYDVATGAPTLGSDGVAWAGTSSEDFGLEVVTGTVAGAPWVFVTGKSPGAGAGSDIVTVGYRLNATTCAATQAWAVRYSTPGNDVPTAMKFAGLSTPEVLVTGSADGGAQYVTLAYKAANGARLWARGYKKAGGSTFDGANAIAVAGSMVYVTGASYGGSTTGLDMATVAYSAATGTQRWAARWNGSADGADEATGVTVAGSAVFVTGSFDNGAGYETLAYSASKGSKLWGASYAYSPGATKDCPTAVVVSGSRVVVTGQSYGGKDGTNLDYATVAYNASTGAQLWASRYNGAADADDQPAALAATSGGIFVTGRSSLGGTSGEFATVAYDPATGARRWVALYGADLSSPRSQAVAVVTDGSSVVVTGPAGDRSAIETIAYDQASGAVLWSNAYQGPAQARFLDSAGRAAAATVGQQPMVFFSGGSDGGTGYGTVAVSATTGQLAWSQTYRGRADNLAHATSIGVGASSCTGGVPLVFVTGQADSGPPTNYDYDTLAYRADTGAQVWETTYDGGAHGGMDGALALTVATVNSSPYVFVTGTSPASAGSSAVTVAYDACTGTAAWTHRFATATSGAAIAVGGSRVFVTGPTSSSGADGQDYATVAYDAASGTLLWSARYNDPANRTDRPAAVAVSPDGSRVFVTGGSDGGPTGRDYATVAYDAATGTRLWVSRYSGLTAFAADAASAVTVAPDGSTVYVTGTSDGGATGRDYATVAYDAATGTRRWVARYDDGIGGDDGAVAAAVSPDGTELFVTGTSDGGATGRDYATVAYDAATGTQRWVARYDGGEGNDDASSVVTLTEGTSTMAVVLGSSFRGSSNYDDVLVNYQG